jgi:hypothetical protein
MTSRSSSRQFPQPLDRAALILMVLLSVLIGVLLLTGDRTAPRVREFTWQDKQVGAEDIAFILTFSQPMEHSSVENNLHISPALPGRISWAGRRMAYTLNEPAPYGTEFALELKEAVDALGGLTVNNQMEPFQGKFRTRDRAFAYLGSEGEQQGKLVLQNLTQQQELVLTPPNLTVLDFQPYPLGDRILFSATDNTEPQQGARAPKLYSVSTGIQPDSPDRVFPSDRPQASPAAVAAEPGVITEILDNQGYQNLRFDLSADGRTIVVQRVSRTNPTDFGLWMIREGRSPQPMDMEPSGDFLITPDSEAIAVLQGEGTAILPLTEEGPSSGTVEPIDFLPRFGRVLSFAKDGTAAAMVKFNVDFTESLFIVTSFGDERELLRTVEGGSVLNAQFDARNEVLYCLVTKATKAPAPEADDERTLFPGEIFIEQPYLVAIVLETGDQIDLLQLPIQPDLQMSVSPDNLGILFDQRRAIAPEDADPEAAIPPSRSTTSTLWFLPLARDETGIPMAVAPEALPIQGGHPRWLP